eukprot:GGOE01041230.1.p1 GENE.GGOE01041230.1~~GGOE01041230.1.p1  ORF type:complete len:351 (+),score=59.63 GGOE01041230.1:49-1053(+)
MKKSFNAVVSSSIFRQRLGNATVATPPMLRTSSLAVALFAGLATHHVCSSMERVVIAKEVAEGAEPAGPTTLVPQRQRRSGAVPVPGHPEFGVFVSQGRQKTCWSYAIGNAVARAAQVQYGCTLRPEDIANWIKTETGCFHGARAAKAVQFLAGRSTDPGRPVVFGCYRRKGSDLVPDGSAVCVQVKNVRTFTDATSKVKGMKNSKKQVFRRQGPGQWPQLVQVLRQPPSIAVVSMWSKVEGDLCSGGHCMCFIEVAGDDEVICKNSWVRKPTMPVTSRTFKWAVVFDVSLHEPTVQRGPRDALGRRRRLSCGPELPRLASGKGGSNAPPAVAV